MSGIVIREIKESDAENFLGLIKKLAAETQFMMREPGEVTETVGEYSKRINRVISTPNNNTLVAENKGEVIGYISLKGGEFKRNKHSAHLVIGILQVYCGKGVGTRLLEKMEGWARKNRIHRLELTVMSHNKIGLALYEKMGFQIEGTKKDSIFVNSSYLDEYYMAKILL